MHRTELEEDDDTFNLPGELPDCLRKRILHCQTCLKGYEDLPPPTDPSYLYLASQLRKTLLIRFHANVEQNLQLSLYKEFTATATTYLKEIIITTNQPLSLSSLDLYCSNLITSTLPYTSEPTQYYAPFFDTCAHLVILALLEEVKIGWFHGFFESRLRPYVDSLVTEAETFTSFHSTMSRCVYWTYRCFSFLDEATDKEKEISWTSLESRK